MVKNMSQKDVISILKEVKKKKQNIPEKVKEKASETVQKTDVKGERKTSKWILKVELPLDWKEKIDQIMYQKGYKTYSELVRDLLRSLIIKEMP